MTLPQISRRVALGNPLPASTPEVGSGLNTRERHELATCWNDEEGKHQPARWGEVLWKVERILAARDAEHADRLAAVEAERDRLRQQIRDREANGAEKRAESVEAERDTALREVAERDARLAKVEAVVVDLAARKKRLTEDYDGPRAELRARGYGLAISAIRAALANPDGA